MALAEYGICAYAHTRTPDPRASAYIGHPVGGPIGGGPGYLHYYSPSGAEVVDDATNALRLAHLKDALANAGSGDVIWLPSGADIDSSARLGTLKPGAVLASDRGKDGNPGARLRLTAELPGTYKNGFIYCGANSHFSGLVLQGPSATGMGENCGIRTSGGGVKKVEVENLYIDGFNDGGFFDDGNLASWGGTEWVGAHYIHHTYIAHTQRGGMGYGISPDFAQAFFWADCCVFRDNRHHVAIPGYQSGYEASYCDFGNAWNDRYTSGDPQHQVDWHGSGVAGYAASITMVHHCNMSRNEYPYDPSQEVVNCNMRGKVAKWANLHHNWTKKTAHKGRFPAAETDGARYVAGYGLCKVTFDGFCKLSEHESGPWGGTNDMPKYNLFVHDNWWGTDPPPGDCDDQTPLKQFVVTIDIRERSN